jgi:hypothetical protein
MLHVRIRAGGRPRGRFLPRQPNARSKVQGSNVQVVRPLRSVQIVPIPSKNFQRTWNEVNNKKMDEKEEIGYNMD